MSHEDLNEREHGPDTSEKVADVQEEETQAFLDALTLRNKGELDINLAKSMQTVLGQAIRMVEAGTADADKASPGGASSLPSYTNLVFDAKLQSQYLHGHSYDAPEIKYVVGPYTSEASKLLHDAEARIPQGMLAEGGEQIEVDPKQNFLLSHGGSSAEGSGHREEFSAARILVAGGIPVGTFAVGLLLLIGSAITSPVRPNPYLAMSVVIAGIGLILTAVVALREREQAD